MPADRERRNKAGFDRPVAKKGLGQNFLVHIPTVETIVKRSGIKDGDCIVELGVGQGDMTRIIARAAARVIGIEKDARLIAWLATRGNLPENVEIRYADMLDLDWKGLGREVGGRVKVMGNLPYNISSQLLFRLLDQSEHIEWAVLMFQKEVADRLLARPGSKSYGILSVLTACSCRVSRIMDVPPTLFRPRPKVTSTVIRLEFPEDLDTRPYYDSLKDLVRYVFQKRRKKLKNAMAGLKGLPTDGITGVLSHCGIDPGVRPDALSLADFLCLAKAIQVAKRP